MGGDLGVLCGQLILDAFAESLTHFFEGFAEALLHLLVVAHLVNGPLLGDDSPESFHIGHAR